MAADGSVVIEIDADASGFESSIKGLSKEAEAAFSGVKEWNDVISEVSTAYNSLGNAIKANAATGQDSTAQYEKALELLGEQISATEYKLEEMKSAQHSVNEAFANNDIGLGQWASYQEEIAKTAAELERLKEEQSGLQNDGIDHFLKDTSGGFNDVSVSADEAGNSASMFGDMLKANLASEAIKMAVSELVKVIQELGQEMSNIVVEAGAMGDTIDKQSQRLGMSNEAYQEWSYILSQNGADISTLRAGMRTLTNQIDELSKGSDTATSAFNKLGIQLQDLQGLTGEEQLSLVIERLQGMEDVTERNAVANDVLGRSYMDLIPLLNQSTDTVEELRQRAHDTNQLMTDEGVQAAVDYTDAMDTLTKSFAGFKNNIGAEVLPGIVDILNGITDLINGVDGAEDEITQGIETALKSFEKVVPRVGTLLNKIVSAAGEKAPEIITAIVQALVKGLPKVSEAILGLVPVIVQAIADILPDVGTAAAEIANQIFKILVETITDAENFAKIFNAMVEFGYNLCTGIADGIVNYDWAAFTNTLLTKLGNVLDTAQKHTMLWIDNLFGGGKVFGGDINNVTSTDWMKNWREGAQVVTEVVDDATTAAQEYYNTGKGILSDVFKTTADTVEEGEEEAEEVIEDAEEAETEAIKNYTQAIVDESEETKEAQQKLGKELQDALDNLDHLFKTHQITEEEYWARKKALLEKYREADNEAWWEVYDDVTEHYQKLTETEKAEAEKARQEQEKLEKQAEQEQEKARQKAESTFSKATATVYKDTTSNLTSEISSIKKSFDTLYAEYEKGYNAIISQRDKYKQKLMGGSVFEVLQGVDEKTGEKYTQYTINDLKKRLKERTEFAQQLAALEAKGLSSGLIAELESMDIDTASIFADQLLGMSDKELSELTEAYDALDAETTRLANDRYADELQNLNDSFITQATELFDGMGVDLKTLGYDGAIGYINNFTRGFDEGSTEIKTSLDNFFEYLTNGIKNGTIDLTTILENSFADLGLGDALIDAMIEEINSGKSDVQQAVEDLIDLDGYLDKLYSGVNAQAAKQSSAGYSSAGQQTQQQQSQTTQQTAPQTIVVQETQQSKKQTVPQTITIDANLKLTDKAGQIIADLVNTYNKRIEIGEGK